MVERDRREKGTNRKHERLSQYDPQGHGNVCQHNQKRQWRSHFDNIVHPATPFRTLIMADLFHKNAAWAPLSAGHFINVHLWASLKR
jgi:hypothetical protein